MFFLSNSIQSKIDIRDVLSYEKWQKTVRREEQKSIELERERNEEKEWHCLWMCIPKYNLLHIAYAFYDYCSWSKFVVCISRHDLVPMTIKLHKRLWWKLGECEEGEYVRCCFCLILFLYTLHTTLSNDSEVCQSVLNLLPL